jgi:hypothetical protein
MSDDNKVQVEFGAKYDELKAGVQKAADAVTEATNKMKEGLESTTTASVAFGTMFEKIGEKLGEAMKEMAREASEMLPTREHIQN